MITTFGGGVGAGKFLEGLYSQDYLEELNIIVNTADDIDIYDVRVSPDIDSILYWLSGKVDRRKGWGIKGDTFNHLNERKNNDSWFNLGDLDLAENLRKKHFMSKGLTLQEVVNKQRKKLKIKKAKIFPMCNEEVETFVGTRRKKIHFQEYLIKYKMKPKIDSVTFKNIRKSHPSKGVIEKINKSKLIIFCPSNPIISIGPILSVPGIRKAVKDSRAIKVAISPIVGDKAFKGPVLNFMKAKGFLPSVLGVASFYKDLVDYLMIDNKDKEYEKKIKLLGIVPIFKDIRMTKREVSIRMAKSILELIDR
ncbi:2-phospho-L-lactate transferase [bacterium]|jgi:LPPG:FO 2-phospho-L-lactate transferase|nr:2-phospho-L-lactate transferase [bacterium]MBT3794955.1 2-phospho-L-lactate transferase [bacterium]MBT4634691.1 2-phospho-L-lactate transferase [bacterium]